MALQYSEIDDSTEISCQPKVQQKKLTKNNTVSFDTKKKENVAEMMKLINNTNGYTDSTDHEGLTDFNPPPHAVVSLKTALPNTYPPLAQSAQSAQSTQPQIEAAYEIPTIVTKPASNVSTIPFENTDAITNHGLWNKNEYKNVPYFAPQSEYASPDRNAEIMINKLNLLIKLLEDQRNEKTGYVNEEIILYAFLGIFIIFIVDSFARSGKYTR